MRGLFTTKDYPVIHPPGSYVSTVQVIRDGVSIGYLAASPAGPGDEDGKAPGLAASEALALRVLSCEHLVTTIQEAWSGRGRFVAQVGDTFQLEPAELLNNNKT